MRRVAVVGTGGCAREVHQIIEDCNAQAPAWDFVGFIDDNPALHGQLVHGCPVLGGLAALATPELAGVAVLVGIGNPQVRREMVQRLEAGGAVQFATLVHPGATVGQRVAIGAGSMVWADAVITTDAQLGRHVIINTGSSVSHDAQLADFVTFAPGVRVAGAVLLGEAVDMGIGAVVIQGRSVGAGAIIGAGAVVVRDVPANVTAVGVPARTIKLHDPVHQEEPA